MTVWILIGNPKLLAYKSRTNSLSLRLLFALFESPERARRRKKCVGGSRAAPQNIDRFRHELYVSFRKCRIQNNLYTSLYKFFFQQTQHSTVQRFCLGQFRVLLRKSGSERYANRTSKHNTPAALTAPERRCAANNVLQKFSHLSAPEQSAGSAAAAHTKHRLQSGEQPNLHYKHFKL